MPDLPRKAIVTNLGDGESKLMPKPVVCHLIERLVIGGAETLLYRLASAQRGGKYEPVVCSLEGGPIQSLLDEEGIPRVNLERARPSIINLPRFAYQMTTIFRTLARTFREHRVSIIHAHLQDSNLIGAVVGAYCNIAVVGTYHGLKIFPPGRSPLDPRNVMRRRLYRLAGRLSDRTIAVSTPVRDQLCDEIGLRPDKTVLVLNGVDTNFFAHAEASPRLLAELGVAKGRRIVTCVGRLIRAKNQHVLVRAMTRVRARCPDVALLLVGDGPRANDLEALVLSEGLQGTVLFARQRTDVAAILSASELFVLPSDFEGIPLSLIEAMASGKPVIATAVPGNVDVIGDARFGTLVPPRDPDALADAIIGLLAEPDRARAIGRAGQAHVQANFDIRSTLAQVQALYDDVLLERAARDHRAAAV